MDLRALCRICNVTMRRLKWRQKITELDPDDVLAHTSLSVLYQKKGMIPEAEAEGAKARVLGWKQQLKKDASGCSALAAESIRRERYRLFTSRNRSQTR